MKHAYVRGLRDGAALRGEPFLLIDLSVEMARTGEPFLSFVVQDRTGSVAGRWRKIDSDLVDDLEVGAGVRVTGAVVAHDGALQIEAEALAAVAPGEMGDWSDYLPVSPRAPEDMRAELEDTIASLRPPLRELVAEILLAPDFLPRYLRAPAARRLHHACIGGLAEHGLAVARLCRTFAAEYPAVDRDLLLAAALLHDAGKVYEYSAERGFEHTFEGRLVGHIVLMSAQLDAAIRRRGDVPEGLRVRLLHAIAAHHGRLEYGSPVVPATLEAVLLHQADVTDSQARGFLDHVAHAGRNVQPWTEYSRMFETELLKPEAPED